MKTKILMLGMALSLLSIGCNKDDNNNTTTPSSPLTAAEVKDNDEMDKVSDDVAYIAESQSDAEVAGRPASTLDNGFLGSCGSAGISTTISGSTYTRTIDFGATNCTLFNGNTVRGKIIITFTNDFTASTRTINYSFLNFYHNDRHIEGSRNVVKTIVNGHPTANISLDLTVTTPSGDVYHRTGQRVREFIAGYDTLNLLDNEFSITGNWTTTFPNGTVQTATVTSPVIVKWSCAHIVQGTITITRNNNVAVLDYGNGECDDDATITINGILIPFHL